jgi:hypothetical protein
MKFNMTNKTNKQPSLIEDEEDKQNDSKMPKDTSKSPTLALLL